MLDHNGGHWRVLRHALPVASGFLRRGESRIHVREEKEVLIEPCAFEDCPHRLLRSSQHENASVVLDALHRRD